MFLVEFLRIYHEKTKKTSNIHHRSDFFYFNYSDFKNDVKILVGSGLTKNFGKMPSY